MGRSSGPRSNHHRLQKRRPWVWGVIFTLALPNWTHAEFARPSRSDSRNHARAALREIHASEKASLSEASLREIETRILSWRANDYSELPNANTSIANAPYPDLLLATKLPELWAPLYGSNYSSQKENLVAKTSLEAIFDGFLEGFLSGSLPPSLLAQAAQIGPCLASRAVAGRSPKCTLDASEVIENVPTSRLFWARFTCGFIDIRSYCGTRKLLYSALKPQLIEARRSNPDLKVLIEAEFEKRFPTEFEKFFVQEIHATRSQLPALISAKFEGAIPHNLWGPKHRLIEPDRRGSNLVTMKGFARSLETEILGASLLAHDPDPARRGLAAVLFYSAANRLLVLTGGEKGIWRSEPRTYQWVPQPIGPTTSPILQRHPFGGIGIQISEGQAPAFSPWNWEATQSRLFPTQWLSGSQNLPSPAQDPTTIVQNLQDLADLLTALSTFLTQTRPGSGALSRYLGPEDRAPELLNPKLPFIFPSEGRKLAIGTLAGVLQNLVDPVRGHLILKQSGDANFGLGLEIREQVSIHGKTAYPTSTEAVARALLAAHELREHLPGDPDLPEALSALLPQLDQITQIGAIYLGAQAQDGNGAFRSVLGDESSRTQRVLDTVLGLRALTLAWNKSEMLLQLVRIHAGWLALNRLLSSAETRESLPPDVAWEILTLWRETQLKVRSRLGPDFTPVVNWNEAESITQNITALLRGQSP